MPNVAKALEIAMNYGGIDGAHHKDWVIDQMVRALTDCPVVLTTVRRLITDDLETYKTQGESEAYKTFVAAACDGEDGPETYSWETGIAP